MQNLNLRNMKTPPSSLKQRFSRDRAFTVIELLVVVALLAVLAALVAGLSGPMRASSHRAKCLHNLRASGQAMLLYFTDHNGNFFPSKNWFQYPSTKSGVNRGMREYFGVYSSNYQIADKEFEIDTILTCSAMKAKYPNLYPQGLNRGFGINYYLNAKDPNKKYDSGPSADRPNLAGSALRMSAVPNLSAMWILTEAPVNGGLLGSTNENTAYHASNFMPYPHEGQQNVLFFDGHIESMTKEQFLNPPSKREFWGNLTLTD